MLRRMVGVGVVVLLLAASGGIAADAAVRPASAAGWRVADVITRPKLAMLLTVDPVSKREAWAGGCAASRIPSPVGGPPSSVPLMEHFTGRSWHRVAIPAKLHGCISLIRSSSPGDVWAFGWNETTHFSFSAFALRLRRGHWTVAQRWGTKTVDSNLPVGAAVLGSTNVWVFFEHNTVKHYNGHRWLTTSVPAESFLAGASADSRGGIWALGEFSEVAYHLHFTRGVAHWAATSFSGAIPSSASATSIYARSPDDVWVVGSDQSTRHGRTVFRPVAAHYLAGRWHPVHLSGVMALAGATSDGPSGLWMRRGWDNTGTPPGIVRYASGKLTAVRMPRRAGQRAGILDIATIPGTHSTWAVGAFMNNGALGRYTGVIMKYGR